MLLTAAGIAAVSSSKVETQIVSNELQRRKALLFADAGWAEAVGRIQQGTLVGEDHTTNPGWGTYVVASTNAATQDPDYKRAQSDGVDNDGDGTVDETGERFPQEITSASQSDVNYPWVKVQYRLNSSGQVVLLGDHDNDSSTPPIRNITTGDPIYLITSEGKSGGATRRVEVEFVYAGDSDILTPYSALHAEGPDVDWSEPEAFVSGRDWDPTTMMPIVGAPEVPGLATTLNPQDEIDQLESHGYSGVQCEGLGAEPSIVAATDDWDLEQLRDIFAPQADIVLGSEFNENKTWGTRDDMKIVYRPGKIAIENCKGAGLLIVEGQFHAQKGFHWDGIVVALGDPSTDLTLDGNDSPYIRVVGAFMFGGSGGGNVELKKDTRLLYSTENIALVNQMLGGSASTPTLAVLSWKEL